MGEISRDNTKISLRKGVHYFGNIFTGLHLVRGDGGVKCIVVQILGRACGELDYTQNLFLDRDFSLYLEHTHSD